MAYKEDAVRLHRGFSGYRLQSIWAHGFVRAVHR